MVAEGAALGSHLRTAGRRACVSLRPPLARLWLVPRCGLVSLA
jgi:hypothetical protein